MDLNKFYQGKNLSHKYRCDNTEHTYNLTKYFIVDKRIIIDFETRSTYLKNILDKLVKAVSCDYKIKPTPLQRQCKN